MYYNIRPKNALEGVTILCFHPNIRCNLKEQREAKSCRLGLCRNQNKKAQTSELGKFRSLNIHKCEKRWAWNNLEVVDSRNNMETKIKKWKHIFEVIMANFHFHHHRNKPIYKVKWGSLYMTTKMLQAKMKNIRTCLYKTRSRKDC
jgi:hypothetical protein